jgi:hypothetical protein
MNARWQDPEIGTFASVDPIHARPKSRSLLDLQQVRCPCISAELDLRQPSRSSSSGIAPTARARNRYVAPVVVRWTVPIHENLDPERPMVHRCRVVRITNQRAPTHSRAEIIRPSRMIPRKRRIQPLVARYSRSPSRLRRRGSGPRARRCSRRCSLPCPGRGPRRRTSGQQATVPCRTKWRPGASSCRAG